jgi:ABC-type phosphate transport system substrate-binding protein
VSCGGEQLAGGGIGGTGITTGTVTGFGSVFVNGVEFDTAGASMDIDDVPSTSDGTDDASVLGIGMVVTVTGTVNADGVTGTATAISYDEIFEGPITAEPDEDVDMQTKTFEVFGITVVADSNTTVFVGTDYSSLAAWWRYGCRVARYGQRTKRTQRSRQLYAGRYRGDF